MVLTPEHRAICRHEHDRHLQRHSLRLLDQIAEHSAVAAEACSSRGAVSVPRSAMRGYSGLQRILQGGEHSDGLEVATEHCYACRSPFQVEGEVVRGGQREDGFNRFAGTFRPANSKPHRVVIHVNWLGSPSRSAVGGPSGGFG
jgi:hypothetical protein